MIRGPCARCCGGGRGWGAMMDELRMWRSWWWCGGLGGWVLVLFEVRGAKGDGVLRATYLGQGDMRVCC
jgi:hypothetical protein